MAGVIVFICVTLIILVLPFFICFEYGRTKNKPSNEAETNDPTSAVEQIKQYISSQDNPNCASESPIETKPNVGHSPIRIFLVIVIIIVAILNIKLVIEASSLIKGIVETLSHPMISPTTIEQYKKLASSHLEGPDELAAWVKISLTEKITKDPDYAGLEVGEVFLIKESSTKFTGLVEYRWEGETEKVALTVTSDGNRAMYECDSPRRLFKKKTTSSVEKYTLDKFDQIKDGMTYKDVVKILGDKGEQISSSEINGETTENFMWQNSGAGSIDVMFQNGVVFIKSQFGLKNGSDPNS